LTVTTTYSLIIFREARWVAVTLVIARTGESPADSSAGLPVCSGSRIVHHIARRTTCTDDRASGLLGQRDRVEHTPRGDRTRPVDALLPDDARYVCVLDE